MTPSAPPPVSPTEPLREQYGVEDGGISWITEIGAPPAPLAPAAVS